MMECPQIFKMASTYYLLFSDIGTKRVIYRKSTSVNGSWSYPVGGDILDNVGYSAKTASNGTNRYIWGWNVVGSTWAGDLRDNVITQAANGDLIVGTAGSASGGRVASPDQETKTEEESNLQSGIIYPNPSEDIYTVNLRKFTNSSAEHVSIKVVDINGKTFEDKVIVGEKEIALSAKDLNMEPGIYIVKIKSSTNQLITKIVVK